MRLDVFAVHHAGDCGDIEARLFGYILEHHRLELGVIAVQEVVVLEVEYGLHGALEGVLPLLQGLYEPFGRVYLLADESGRFLLGTVSGALCFGHHVGVFPVHAELGDIEARHSKGYLTVVFLQNEVRHNLLGLVGIAIVQLPAGGGIETRDAGNGGLQPGFIQAKSAHHLVEMAVGKLLELLVQDAVGILHILRLRAGFQLDQQAFAKVPGADSGRVELLHHLQHRLHLLLGDFHPGTEGEVVHKGLDVASQIPVRIQAADDEGPYLVVPFAEVAITELVHQALGKALMHGEGVILGAGVLSPVVDAGLVGRNLAVVLYLVDGDVFGLIVVLLLFGIGAVVQHRILLELGTYLLLQLLHRQLDELYGLDLERRKTLCLFKFETLFLHTLLCYFLQNFECVHTVCAAVFHRRILEALLHNEGRRELRLDGAQGRQGLGFIAEIPYRHAEIRAAETPVCRHPWIQHLEAVESRLAGSARGLGIVEEDADAIAAHHLAAVGPDAGFHGVAYHSGLAHVHPFGKHVEDGAAFKGGIHRRQRGEDE